MDKRGNPFADCSPQVKFFMKLQSIILQKLMTNILFYPVLFLSIWYLGHYLHFLNHSIDAE